MLILIRALLCKFGIHQWLYYNNYLYEASLKYDSNYYPVRKNGYRQCIRCKQKEIALDRFSQWHRFAKHFRGIRIRDYLIENDTIPEPQDYYKSVP